MPLTVAVTGATGFIGQALVPRLLAPAIACASCARQLPEFAPGAAGPVEVVLGDLGQPAALDRLVDGVDAVLHLAGLVKARAPRISSPSIATASADLLAAIARKAATHRNGGPRFILLSSLAAREPQLSPYAASKRAGEEVLRPTDHGLPWLAVRAPVVYGPGDRETLAFFKAVEARHRADGRQRLGPHLRHPCRRTWPNCCARLAEVYLPLADAYEIDDGAANGYSLRDFAQEAAAALDRPARFLPVPRLVMKLAAGLQQGLTRLDGKPRILSPAKVREIFHADWVSHDRRLAGFLGWQAQIRLAEGFADVVAWYRRKHWL